MRELKFRAWDKKRKRMFAVTTINASGAVSVFIDDDGLYLLPAEQIELMQYTGLKDKNGKEIYAGDIVRVSYGYNYEVKQHRTGAWRIGRDDLCVWADSSEVIGNIHENPELLKEEG